MRRNTEPTDRKVSPNSSDFRETSPPHQEPPSVQHQLRMPRFSITPQTIGMSLPQRQHGPESPPQSQEDASQGLGLSGWAAGSSKEQSGPGPLQQMTPEEAGPEVQPQVRTPAHPSSFVQSPPRTQQPQPLAPDSECRPAAPPTPSKALFAQRAASLLRQWKTPSPEPELCSGSKETTKTTTTNNNTNKSEKSSLVPHSVLQTTASLQQLPTEYYERQLEKYGDGSELHLGEAAKVNGQLNKIFLRRLQDIDANAEGDADLKLVTYQEWVDMLLKINEAIISNVEDLEAEVAERLELAQRKVNVNCRHSQGNELLKCRKDLGTLLKVIQNAYHHDNWNMEGLTFETITHAQVLGLTDQRPPAAANSSQTNPADSEAAQRNKLLANMKALAVEVAEKHDELRELKKQVLCLEDEIQKAQQKIQLKDDVIKELRNDLKSANAKLTARTSPESCPDMPPVNIETQPSNTSRSATTQVSECNQLMFVQDDGSQFESLSHSEHVEQQKLRILEDELNELFEMTKDLKKQNLEYHRKRLSDIFQKSESEKAEAYRKLDFIRRQLIDLEATSSEANRSLINDCDSGFSSKSEHDQDAKIVEAVRKRLRKLNECIFDLKKRVQKLEIENNELATSLDSEKSFGQRNGEILKEVADLLCGMRGEQFSYEDIYSAQCNGNPFCEAIVDMKKDFQEREAQLLLTVGIRNRKIEELTEALLNSEKQFGQQRVDKLNETLKCQIEHLQHTVVEREQRINQLAAMLARISQIHQTQPHNALEFGPTVSHTNNALELERANSRIESLTKELERCRRQEQFLHSETRKLNDELNESKRKNGDLSGQSRRLAALLKTQESHRMEVAAKYEALERSFEDQAKKLRAANAQLHLLNERFLVMEKRQDEHNMERKLLREEVLCLKEKEATLMGKQKSIQEQLLKTERELYTAHDVIKEQQCILQHNELAQKEAMKRLQEANNDTRRKLASTVKDYKQLEEEYEKQAEVAKQNEKLIESFRKWKEAQIKAEEATRASFKQYEEHIQLLLEDKQKFLEQYRDLHRDYSILQGELDRLKMCSFSTSGCNNSENSIAQRMELIRRTSRRVSEQSSSLLLARLCEPLAATNSAYELQ